MAWILALLLLLLLAVNASADASADAVCTNSTLAQQLPFNALVKEKSEFWRNGYTVVRDVFTAHEMGVVRRVVLGGAADPSHGGEERPRSVHDWRDE